MSKRILAVALAALMLLTMAFTASAAVQATSVLVRGQVVSYPEDVSATLTWDAQSFAGFFYDIKNNRKTETLKIINQDLTNLDNNRTIADKNLIYQTGKEEVEFKVYEKEKKGVITTSEFYNDTYPVVGWRAEKWIAIKGNANKLSKLIFEMDKEEKKTLTSGETWSLGSGYELTINAVDARASPRQVWFSLKKDGALIDDGISSENHVYYKTQTIKGESDALLFTVFVERIFSGATSDMAQFRYAWLTDAGSAIEIQSSDTYDKFKVKEASKDRIILENDGAVSLSKNTDTKLLGDIYFKIADSDNLRFYPKVDYVISGEGPEGNETPEATGIATPKATVNVTNVTGKPIVSPPPGETVRVGETEKPEAEATATPKDEPGFEGVFAIAGLLAVAYLVLRKRK